PSGELETILYAQMKDSGDIKKLDIKGDDLPAIQQMFVRAINSNIVEKDNFSVLTLSTADERGNCFYTYDLELPEELSQLESVIGNDDLPTFDFTEDELFEISALIIVIADE